MDAVIELARGLVPSLLLIAVLLVVRRSVTRGRIGGGGTQLRVSGRTGVARGASVAVVEVDRRRFLIGASEHGVGLISELGPAATTPDGAQPQEIVLPGEPAPTDTAGDGGPVGDGGPSGTAPTRATVSGPQDGWAEIAPESTQDDGPRSGLVHRLQQMTVRTHVEAPLREHL